MRRYDQTCQCDELELGILDCCCRFCVQLRLLQVEDFIATEKLRMAWCPRMPRDDLDESGEVYVRLLDEHTEARRYA